tara:strand:+ start:2431 stop:3291 length:861 start_codon:yes stop_codon:yes gene_type:complete
MEKEKVIVARNYDSSAEGGIQHHGVEVSIGRLTVEKSELLKTILQNKTLFEEKTLNFNTFQGSDFLTELMNINEEYHKQGMITYEGELFRYSNSSWGDSEELSTKNWLFGNDENKNDKATMVVFNWQEDEQWEEGNILKIPKEGISVVSIRSESLYFYAEGNALSNNKKIIPDISDKPVFDVQPGIDSIWFGLDFGGFNILHSVFVDGEEIERNFEKEERGGQIYYSTHLLFKDGIVIGWLATNNNPHFFPFDYVESSLPCISPYLKNYDPTTYESAIESLLEKLQ